MFDMNKYILEAKDKEDLLVRLIGFDKLYKEVMTKAWEELQNKPVVLEKKRIKKAIKKQVKKES